MKRSQVFLLVFVFGFLLVGFLQEQTRRTDPTELLHFTSPAAAAFEELVPPIGVQAISGTVRTHDDRPAAGVEVFLSAKRPAEGEAPPLHWMLTGADGSFGFDQLEERTYGVILSLPGHRPLELEVEVPAPGRITWVLEAPQGPVDPLRPVRRSELLGRVEVPSDHPDSARLSPEGYEVRLIPVEEDPLRLEGSMRRRDKVAADGTFRFDQAVEAEYRLELLPPWAASGTWPVIDSTRISHGAANDPTPVLQVRSGSLRGRVSDPMGRAIEGALVIVRPEESPERVWPAVTSGSDGGFVVGDLPAGRYRLRVRAGAGAQEQTVEVRAGVALRVDLPPIETRRLPDD